MFLLPSLEVHPHLPSRLLLQHTSPANPLQHRVLFLHIPVNPAQSALMAKTIPSQRSPKLFKPPLNANQHSRKPTLDPISASKTLIYNVIFGSVPCYWFSHRNSRHPNSSSIPRGTLVDSKPRRSNKSIRMTITPLCGTISLSLLRPTNKSGRTPLPRRGHKRGNSWWRDSNNAGDLSLGRAMISRQV